MSYPRKLKRVESGLSFFQSWVNAMERRPYWWARIEVSYCTFEFRRLFGAICTRYLYHVIHRTIRLPLFVRDSVHVGKAIHVCLAGLATKKSGGGTITLIHSRLQHVIWPPHQISLKFPWSSPSAWPCAVKYPSMMSTVLVKKIVTSD